MKKRFFPFALAVTLVFAIVPMAWAAPMDYPMYADAEDAYHLIRSNFLQGQDTTVFYYGILASSMQIQEEIGYYGAIDENLEFAFSTDEDNALVTVRASKTNTAPVHLSLINQLFPAKAQQTIAKAKEVVASVVKPNMSEREIALSLHDWICDHVTYDFETWNYALQTKGENPNHESYYAVGALLNGVAVCGGIAGTYEMLCTEAGLACEYIRSEDHAWNVVRIDGKWYTVDVTFDLPLVFYSLADDGSYTAEPEYDKKMSHTNFMPDYLDLGHKGDVEYPVIDAANNRHTAYRHVTEEAFTATRSDDIPRQPLSNIKPPETYTPPVGNWKMSAWALEEYAKLKPTPATITTVAGSNYDASGVLRSALFFTWRRQSNLCASDKKLVQRHLFADGF